MYNPKTGDARITGSTASLLGLETGLKENNQNQIDASVSKILLMHGIILSFGGIPLVYYGDELASLNDYSYLNENDKKDDSRWLNRPVIDWQVADRRNQDGTIEQRVFSGLKKMIALRKTMPEFYSENDYTLVENDNPHIFSFVRQNGWHKTLVVANIAASLQQLPQSVIEHAGFGHYVNDAHQDQPVDPIGGNYILQPYQFLWLKQR